jgi:formiminotetrahydrofolate cyclodeaminase
MLYKDKEERPLMKLIDQTLEDFTGLLASENPTPGGGSTAALEAALGISLIAMVAVISGGKREYAHRKGELQRIAEEAQGIRQTLLALVEEDTAAYNAIMAAKGRSQEQPEALQKALKSAVRIPHKILVMALRGLHLAEELSQGYYRHTASDLGLGVQSLKVAAQGADLTVLINLGSLSDETFGKQYRSESQTLLDEAVLLADTLYGEVRSGLMGRIG